MLNWVTVGEPLDDVEKEQEISLALSVKSSVDALDDLSTVRMYATEDQPPANCVPPIAPPAILGLADCTAKVVETVALESTEFVAAKVTELLAAEHFK